MSLIDDSETAAEYIQILQQKLWGQGDHAKDDELTSIISMLESPLFRQLLTLQESLQELQHVSQNQAITEDNFDITTSGELLLNETPEVYPPESVSNSSTLKLRGQPFTNAAPTTSGHTYNNPDFLQSVERTAAGREIHTVQLYKPENSSLGFSVVGIKKEDEELGIYVKDIQPGGIVDQDGRLQEHDQLLAIDGQPLDSSHANTIAILQSARGPVEILVARGPTVTQHRHPEQPQVATITAATSANDAPARGGVEEEDDDQVDLDTLTETEEVGKEIGEEGLGDRLEFQEQRDSTEEYGERHDRHGEFTPTAGADFVVEKSDMVLSTDWTQLQVIDLINDGTGLGFGIIGGRSTGVVVKTILPGGIADQDGHLRSGDHILQIGDVNVRGMSSEQVALVLRQSGNHVRLVVARSVMELPQFQMAQAPVIPTHQLEEYMDQFNRVLTMDVGEQEMQLHQLHIQQLQQQQLQQQQSQTLLGSVLVHPQPLEMAPEVAEVDVFEVDLMKDSNGLGITIAGYVGGDSTPDEISGIFVKSITEGSAAAVDGRVQVNDQIIEVDGKSLQGFSNHEAVEVLRNTSQMVRLKLVRFRHGPKYDKLQEYLAQANQSLPHPSSTSSSRETSAVSNPTYDLDSKQIELEDIHLVSDDYSGDLQPEVESSVKAAWEPIVGNDFIVVVAQLSKFKEGGGLGISLEGTVDVEEGVEMRPHHYIRSILPDGPVGMNGRLKSSDELLEVNSQRLLGLNHVNVVDILKDLPQHVRLVCARRKTPFEPPDVSLAETPLAPPSSDGLEPQTERLVKAKSEVALHTATGDPGMSPGLNKNKSRSLDPLSGLAMWNPTPVVIELEKGERGLGFSILDYQDPVNPCETVIVIRSLVPGGVAQTDGRLVPGDRLIFVNDVSVEHATLEEAVMALKGAGRGVVNIGVAKPLPLNNGVNHQQEDSNSTVSDVQLSPNHPTTATTVAPYLETHLPYHPPTSTPRDQTLASSMPPDLIIATERSLVEHQQQHHQQPSPSYPTVPRLELDTSSTNLEDGADRKSLSSDIAAPLSLEHSFAQSDTSSSEADRNKSLVGRKDSFYESDEERTPRCTRKNNGAVAKPADSVGEILTPPAYEHAVVVASSATVTAAVPSVVLGSDEDTTVAKLEPEPLMDSSEDHVPLSLSSTTPSVESTLVVTTSSLPLPSYYEAITSSVSPQSDSVVSTSPVITPRSQQQQQSQESPSLPKAPMAKLDSTDSESDQMDPSPGPSTAPSPPSPSPPPLPPLSAPPRRVPPPIPPKPSNLRTSLLKHNAQEKDAPPLPSSPPPPEQSHTSESPPPFPVTPVTPATPPLRPVPCSPKWDLKRSPGLGIGHHRRGSNSSVTDQVTSSDLKTPPGSPRTLSSPGSSGMASPDLLRMPSSSEKTIQISKGNLHLGLTLEAVDKAINGCQIKSIAKPSATEHDERLQVGDLVVSVNNENLRKITTSQARAILRRSSLLGADVSITYIPATSIDSGGTGSPTTSGPHQSPLLNKLSESLSEEPKTVTPPSSLPADSSESANTTTSDGKVTSPGQKTLHSDGSPAVGNQAWGPPRTVELVREAGKSLGISIVGGRVDMFNVSQEHSNAGIFIKHVLGDSPAGRNGTLKKGDRILEVNGLDVRNATHDEAVDVIRKSSSPITFVVQSLSFSNPPGDLDSSQLRPVQSFEEAHKGVAHKSVAPQSSITSSSPGSTPQQSFDQKGESFEDSEEEDDFGYTKKRIQKKYNDLPGLIQLVDLNRGNAGMGLGLAGNKDRSKMSVFVAGIQPESPAARDGRIKVGDELLEVNGINLQGLSHLNASATIKGVTTPVVKLVTHRRDDYLEHMAVKPLRYGGSSQFDKQSVPPVAPLLSDSPTSNGRRESRDSAHSGSSPASSANDNVRVIKLQKGSQNLGFGIKEETRNGHFGIYVKYLAQGGVADQDNQLEIGDEILEIDDTVLTALNYDKALQTLRSAQGSVRLKICKGGQPGRDSSPGGMVNSQGKMQLLNTVDESSTDPDVDKSSDPRTCAIQLGKRTYIEIEKGKTGLGLSIVGGSDTLLGAIIIHEVYEDGAAARDARLWAGDQILEVNNEDLTDATHTRALQVLRQTPPVVKMAVYRDESQVREEDILDVFSVELMKRPGKGLGLSIVGKKTDVGIYISDIVKGGVAEADARLMQGDQILAVNGEDMRNSTQEYAAAVLKTLMGKVSLTVGRLKAGSKASSRKNSSHGTSLKKSDSSVSNKSKGRHSKNASEDPNHLRIVDLEQDASGSLGISVAGGVGSPIGDAPVIIASLNPTGPAARSGKLKVGDKVLVINGVPTEGMTHEQVVSSLRGSRKVTLHVVQGEAKAVSVSGQRSRHVSGDMSDVTKKDIAAVEIEDDGQPPQYKTIVLNRGAEGLGFSIVGGHGSPHGDLPIYVKTVFSKGAAADEGTLSRGDQILSVNNQYLDGYTHEDAVNILKNTHGTVVLGILS